MNLLINESPLLILPSLVKQVGLNEAVFLQQLHFRSLISQRIFEGEKWVYKTYEDRGNEFPFWSRNTIRRMIGNLEAKGYLISTSEHNRIKADQTKWYRVNYAAVENSSAQDGDEFPERATVAVYGEQLELTKSGSSLYKERKKVKKDIVGLHHDEIMMIIEYLNLKTAKQFKANAASTKKLLNARLNEGYSVEDFKRVIDLKTTQWLQDEKFRNYLRPSTLFNAKNFENYVNEDAPIQNETQSLLPFELDFTKGEK
ncbi:conserved phage C-terminal domain-containing protein [Sporosarcina obsidiansis]|uniref:conserved phage C-terminal domain-containing protein n=1 Tax=Sporosarcina obsidiansis TaxID=2660748 RepID=UPI00129ADFBB|nr:conserved phage C-terminal domain-containing protein [Sporosarcina obsidiansis]